MISLLILVIICGYFGYKLTTDFLGTFVFILFGLILSGFIISVISEDFRDLSNVKHTYYNVIEPKNIYLEDGVLIEKENGKHTILSSKEIDKIVMSTDTGISKIHIISRSTDHSYWLFNYSKKETILELKKGYE